MSDITSTQNNWNTNCSSSESISSDPCSYDNTSMSSPEAAEQSLLPEFIEDQSSEAFYQGAAQDAAGLSQLESSTDSQSSIPVFNSSEEAFYVGNQSSPYLSEFNTANTSSEPLQDSTNASSTLPSAWNQAATPDLALYHDAADQLEANQSKINAQYQEKSSQPGWYEKSKWVYSDNKSYQQDQIRFEELSQKIENNRLYIEDAKKELSALAQQDLKFRQENSELISERLDSARQLNDETVALETEAHELGAKLAYYGAQGTAALTEKEIQSSLPAIDDTLAQYENAGTVSPFSDHETQAGGFPQDVQQSLAYLNQSIASSEALKLDHTDQLYQRRAELHDIIGAHQKADADLDKIGMGPHSAQRDNNSVFLQRRQARLESSREHSLEQLKQLPHSDGLNAQQAERFYHMNRIQEASQSLGEGEYYSASEMKSAQSWARRSDHYEKLQEHYRQGRLTQENAQEFGLSPNQMESFFDLKSDAQGQPALEYKASIQNNGPLQDEKLSRVLHRLDQQESIDQTRQLAQDSDNPQAAQYLNGLADYQEGKMKDQAHLVNRGEVQLTQFLNETRNQELNPDLTEMRADAVKISQARGLEKIASMRQMSQNESLGTEMYEEGTTYAALTQDTLQKREAAFQKMESQLRNDQAENFDQASSSLDTYREVDKETFRMISFHRVNENNWKWNRDNMDSDKGSNKLPSVSQRQTPEEQRAALKEFSSMHQDNNKVFVDQDIQYDSLKTNEKFRDYALSTQDEEKYVANYKREIQSQLAGENKYSVDDWDKLYSSGEEPGGGADFPTHQKLSTFQKEHDRSDLDFPKNPSPENKPEDYNAILEAMAREDYANHLSDKKTALERYDQDPHGSSAFRDNMKAYNDEFDPLDEWLNVRRGTKTQVAKELAISGAMGEAGGFAVKGLVSGARLYALERKAAKFYRYSKLANQAARAGELSSEAVTLSRSAELGFKAMEKVATYGTDVGANIITSGDVTADDFYMPFITTPATNLAKKGVIKAGTKLLKL